MPSSPLNVLRFALLESDDEGSLAAVKECAAEICRALEEEDFELRDEDLKLLEERRERVALVYLALLGNAESFVDEDDEDVELDKTLERMDRDKDREIAAAFSAALASLPPMFHDWGHWFGGSVPLAAMAEQAYLANQTDVREGGPHAAELVRYGLTPSVFIEASQMVELLMNRLFRDARTQSPPPEESPRIIKTIYERLVQHVATGDLPSLTLTLRDRDAAQGYLPKELLLAQLRGTSGCPLEAVEPMARWLLAAARFKPFLVGGCVAEPEGQDEIKLTEEPIANENGLAWRWGRHTAEAMLAYAR